MGGFWTKNCKQKIWYSSKNGVDEDGKKSFNAPVLTKGRYGISILTRMKENGLETTHSTIIVSIAEIPKGSKVWLEPNSIKIYDDFTNGYASYTDTFDDTVTKFPQVNTPGFFIVKDVKSEPSLRNKNNIMYMAWL